MAGVVSQQLPGKKTGNTRNKNRSETAKLGQRMGGQRWAEICPHVQKENETENESDNKNEIGEATYVSTVRGPLAGVVVVFAFIVFVTQFL